MTAAAISHCDLKPANAPAVRPIVKWAGGKARLVSELLRRLPAIAAGARFFEPFAGGAALFFALVPERAVLGDANADLMAMYRALAGWTDEIVGLTEAHERGHTEAHFESVRYRFNARSLGTLERAAAMLYLNRACFNGLWRVNRAGDFNVGWGKHEQITFDAANLRAAAQRLRRAELRTGDYRDTLVDARTGDAIYLDAPYDGTWADYTAGGFGPDEQRDLAAEARRLVERGCHVMLSNADTSLIRELYAGFRIDTVRARRAINSDGEGRGEVDELIVLAGPTAPIRPSTRSISNPRPERTDLTMATTQTAFPTSIDETIEDVIERGLRRTLPVDLTRDELTDIAIRRATVEQERDDMQSDLDREKKRRQQVIEERNNEIEKMGRELRSKQQDRTVSCTKVFRRELDGSGWVVLLRNDTGAEVTREPASPQVLQRHLPGVDGTPPSNGNGKRSILDEANEAQKREVGGDEPDDESGPDKDLEAPDEPDEEDLEDESGAAPSKPPRAKPSKARSGKVSAGKSRR